MGRNYAQFGEIKANFSDNNAFVSHNSRKTVFLTTVFQVKAS